MSGADMNDLIFEQFASGQAALNKLRKESGELDENFRLFVGEHAKSGDGMTLSGAVFRYPSKGPNKDKLTIMVPGTTRTVTVTRAEIDEFEMDGNA